MARDFRPKDKNRTVRPSRKDQTRPAAYAPAPLPYKAPSAASLRPLTQKPSGPPSDGEEGDEGDEETLKRAIAALGGDEDDLDLVSVKALKAKGKGKGKESIDVDAADDPALGNDLRAFLKGLNFDVKEPTSASAATKAIVADRAKSAKSDNRKEIPTSIESDRPSAVDEVQRSKGETDKKEQREKKKGKAAQVEAEKAAALAKRERDDKLGGIASKAARGNKAEASSSSTKTRDAGKLLLQPLPQWMEVPLAPLPSATVSSSKSVDLTHGRLLSLLTRGTALLEADNAAYHSMLNSGSSVKMTSLGGITPSDAKFIASLLGNTTSSSASAGTGVGGGTLSDRIAAHALLLGSSPLHNLRSLDALVVMTSKKSREESGRATRALADWFAGAGLGKGRKLRYLRDQPDLAAIAEAADDVAKDQRLALFAYEDRLKKVYFTFLQALETQSHDTLPFVRQQAVTQIFLLLREKSEQEQNLLRLLVNKLGDGERSVASKATNNLLELLNIHPAMKGIVAREVGELIRKPTRSASRSDNETTKKHHNHAKYYGVLALNQVILTRGDTEVATSLIHLYFELFEEGLDRQSKDPAVGADGEAAEANGEAAKKKEKGRWRDNKSKGKGKGKGKGKKGEDNSSNSSSVVQDADGKMMAAILTGVRRAFPFADLDIGAFDKHLDTLFRITHAASFNIAVQALQLIHAVATSSTTSSLNLLDRFHSTLYSSMLDPRLASTSKTAMYLNLCFKTIREDIDDARRAAEVKRLLQILGQMDVEFVCGALFLVAELFRAQPRLRSMLTDPEDDDEEQIVNPPDEEGNTVEDAPMAAQTTTWETLLKRSSTRYDPTKRDPRFANAKDTCLWDLTPLLNHFHPTVKLLAHQLLSGQALTTAPDLTLYSLSHFLDKFVYRNPKKKGTLQKGVSGMQPAVSASGDGEVVDGVRKVKGWATTGEEVNTSKFWKRKIQDVPVDSLFFHKYFNLRESRAATEGAEKKTMKKRDGDDEEAEEDDEDEGNSDSASDDSPGSDDDIDVDADAGEDVDSDDSQEREIWAAMKRTMPAEGGHEELLAGSADEDDDDDEDLAMYDYTDSEEEEDGKGGVDESEDDEEAAMFEEDDDDLLPFADFDQDGGVSSDSSEEEKDKGSSSTVLPASKKRSRLIETTTSSTKEEGPKSKSQLARQERKRRKATSTFASAEEYAHLLNRSDGEGDDGDEE